MKLSIAIQTPEVHGSVPVALASGTLAEKCAKIAQWGADGVEFMTGEPKKLDPKEIKQNLQKYRLEPAAVASGAVAFSTGLTLLNADAEKMSAARTRLFELIDLAEALGAPVVTIGGFRGRKAYVAGDGESLLSEILFAAGERARPAGVRLALEALNRFESDLINNAAEGLEFLSRLNHPAVGMLLDTFHVNIEERSWTEPFQKVAAAGKLFHVHLGDNNRLPPGKGLIDFPAIVRTLKDLDYPGYLSAELLARPDPDTAAHQTLEYMRQLI